MSNNNSLVFTLNQSIIREGEVVLRITFFILVLLLAGCNPAEQTTPSAGGGGSSGGTGGGAGSNIPGTSSPGWDFPSSSTSVQYAFMGLNYSHSVLSGLTGGGWNISFSNPAPAWLNASIVSGSVVLSGVPNETNKTYSNFEVRATKASQSFVVRFTLQVRGDLLRPYQWYLENDGGSFFSGNDAGDDDEDMRVPAAWRLGYLGQNVRIAVSDAGLEINHEDLSANLLSGEHRNYDTGDDENNYLANPNPVGEAHGTAVSGIIAAVGWNNIGVTGVAPQARLAGFQFLDSMQTTSMLLSQASGDFDIFNYSYGTGINMDVIDNAMYIAHLRDRVTNGRSGKGQIFVKSAGNEYFGFSGNVPGVGNVFAPQNANIPEENNSPFIILAGATNADGFAASYSNAGSNVWVSAPGGEDGDEDPAIVTTDLMTCSQGYSSSTGMYDFNLFERFSSTEAIFQMFNPSCNYTSMMNGTSSAAPNVAGVVALLLSANSNLTWRDVKHILAVTADKVHATAANSSHYIAALNLAGHVYEQGWVTNAAGYDFHNWYGFGRVNAQAAVAMAASGYSLLPAWFESNPDFSLPSHARNGLALAIPDNSSTGVSDQIDLDLGNGKIVESVQVRVSVTHARSGQVGVELTSPSGTKSILLNINNALLLPVNGGIADANLNVVLTTHAFYGENANGVWTIKMVDARSGDTGVLNSWSLNILGH